MSNKNKNCDTEIGKLILMTFIEVKQKYENTEIVNSKIQICQKENLKFFTESGYYGRL